jgi:uncharacterized membrane protein
MFLVMLILFFVFVRVVAGGHHGHCVPLHHRRHWPLQPASAPRPQAAQPNAFERLKQRYVRGDISDEQYESELDTLLRMPDTRKMVP